MIIKLAGRLSPTEFAAEWDMVWLHESVAAVRDVEITFTALSEGGHEILGVDQHGRHPGYTVSRDDCSSSSDGMRLMTWHYPGIGLALEPNAKEQERITALWRDVLTFYKGNKQRAERFFHRKNALLQGLSPYLAARDSDEGADEVRFLIRRDAP